MKTLFILNDAPYGTERSYNGLRLAGNLAKRDGEEVRIFFIGELGVCGSCMDARGITDEELANGVHRSTLDQLTDWTQWADTVITF